MNYAKAGVGSLIAGLGALSTALIDNGVTMGEWVTVASATLVAFYGVWQVPNSRPDPAAGERLAEPSNIKVGGFTGSGQSGILPPPTTRATGAPKMGGDA